MTASDDLAPGKKKSLFAQPMTRRCLTPRCLFKGRVTNERPRTYKRPWRWRTFQNHHAIFKWIGPFDIRTIRINIKNIFREYFKKIKQKCAIQIKIRICTKWKNREKKRDCWHFESSGSMLILCCCCTGYPRTFLTYTGKSYK